MDGFNFSTDVSVRFAETDAQGIAHHASFVVWCEVARIAYLAEYAGGYLAIQAQGIEALTTEVHVRYLQAARFDDRLRIWPRCCPRLTRGFRRTTASSTRWIARASCPARSSKRCARWASLG